jgi:hypothetical protein
MVLIHELHSRPFYPVFAGAFMMLPSFIHLRVLSAGKPQSLFCSGPRLHPNPAFYKHYWLVFHAGSPCDGAAFLDYSKALCTSAAMILVDELKSQGGSCMLYTISRRRIPSSKTPPWVEVAGYEYAPDFDEDTDPLWQGHK